MFLLVRLWNKSYYKTSNVLLDFTLTKDFADPSSRGIDNQGTIECGYRTISAEGLWYLFITTHSIVAGLPNKFWVQLSEEEAKIFKMIAQTGFWRKRSYWQPVVEKGRSRNRILKELEEMLPVWVLKAKLSVGKKC